MSPVPDQPVVLIIMDGWGCRREAEGNAIAQAGTPNIKRFSRIYPFTLLDAAGEAVGLPPGQMGNSEVGHLNIGAGRIVYQTLSRIERSIDQGELFTNEVLGGAVKRASANGAALHLMGLVSDGGVHSHLRHLFALIDMAQLIRLEKVYIHAILDGRDVPPNSAPVYLQKLMEYCAEKETGRIASISGRYYSMDRDKRWERTRKAYNAYVHGLGYLEDDPLKALTGAYERGETDEFVSPALIVPPGLSPAKIRSGDSLIMFNFRPDRVRQITRAFLDPEMDYFDRGEAPPLPYLVTMTEYDREFDSPIAFPPDYLKNTLGEWMSLQGCRQLRLAETEKYAHVTFFFNGGREEPFPGEDRCLVPSPGVATYDLMPEMSAFEVARSACDAINKESYPFIVINFANSDMVGHTGIMESAVRAVEVVDRAVGLVVDAALRKNYAVLLTGDHGNAEKMVDPHTGKPHTAHTSNPVPLFLVSTFPERFTLEKRGILADIAPTVLDLMKLPVPEEITGRSLLVKKS